MLTLREKAGYAVGAYGLMLFWVSASHFLLYFYTDVLLLSPGSAGSIFLLAMIWDGITDPVMGVLVDRTRTRLGQYRPFILFGALPLALSYVFAFTKPDLPAHLLGTYALITHLVFRLCYTIVYMPFTAFIAKLTADSAERSALTGWKAIFTQLGALTVTATMLKGVEVFGTDDAEGFQRTAAVFAVGGVGVLWLCFRGTAAEVGIDRAREASRTRYSLSELGTVLRRNPPFLLVFAGVLLFVTSFSFITKGTAYYAKYVLGDAQLARLLLSTIAGTALVTVPVWVKLTAMTGKRFVWLAGCACSVTGLFVLFALDRPSVTEAFWCFVVISSGINAFLMNYYSMLSDTVEFGEWKTGIRCEAVMFGFIAFSQKAAVGLGAAVVGWNLAWFGFEANVTQSAHTQSGIRLMVTLFPAAGMLASMLVIAFFRLDAARHGEICREIDARRAREAADPTTVVR